MQLRHIIGLDIVKNEVNRIMPNSLTENQLQGNLINDEAEEQKTVEQIKRDLEDVDDVFAANVWSAINGQNGDISNLGGALDGDKSKENAAESEKPPPEEEWLETSEEDTDEKPNEVNAQFDIS